MKQIININGKRIKLDASQLIQAGGEGMVFDLGDTAVKLYHHPTDHHRAKLNHLFNQQWPDGVLGPKTAVTNTQNQLIGFQMSKLLPGSQPFKRLSNPVFRKKNNMQTQTILALLTQIHQTVTTLHHSQIIIGDLNDTNLFFTPTNTTPNYPITQLPNIPISPSFLDVDSYQIAHFPCPVAMQSFLDPALYGIADFSQKPVFSEATDWYAFAVLLTKCLLQVHPYGGTNHHYKSMRSRAEAKMSVWHTAVTYPQRALPPETLTDDMLHELHLIFAKGHRRPFPPRLLTDYTNNHITCPQCQLVYAQQRSTCPACSHQIPVQHKPVADTLRTLLQVDGFIEHVALRQDGRFWVIIRNGSQYQLILAGIGGKVSDMPLFTGTPGYRFGLFGNYLVVNPPQRPQLLILDVSGTQPKQVTMIETALFRETAVFATTPQHLYRIAGTWIMQGSVQDGHFVEDAVATAHRKQTNYWASPYHDTIAGYHRIFAENRFFLHNEMGYEIDLTMPPLKTGEYIAETAVSFSPVHLALILKIGQKKQFRTEIHTFDYQGKWVKNEVLDEDAWETAVITYPYHHQPLEISKHYQTRQGLLMTSAQAIKYSTRN